MPEEKTITPLPYGKLFVLSCIGISESFSITMIFPFIANMVRDFGYPEDEIGFYAGWIASSFNIEAVVSTQSTGTCLGVLYCMPEEKTITPLPYGKLFVLSCIGISESFSITMIFPFIANMVRDFGYPEDEIGFYAGWIASSFNIAQFMSSFGWGRVADRIGRRSVLLLGLSGNFLMIFLFGWSTNLWYAILARSMNGFLNGNIGVAKTYLGEISDDTNSATCFGLFGMVWGVGSIIGPSVGGFLSNPHETAPHIFPKGSLLYHFPYLLPCIASSFVTLVGFISGLFFLDETLPNASCCPRDAGSEDKPLMEDSKKDYFKVFSRS
eukprot:TRINITY_DN3763_c0_g1_i4.p1 TRINITY_DN3763_c0_g1~~TRINITY_DN3763_c0_g1_i4.p1  ORF type:complete len:325 (-),score=34.68 TRINITY_DN3763_c0_g1_i4:653-1627(-)